MCIRDRLFSIQIIAYLFNPLSEISQLHAQIISQKPSFDRVADLSLIHISQADAKGGKVMQHGAGGRGQDAQSPQKDEGRVEAEHKAVDRKSVV